MTSHRGSASSNFDDFSTHRVFGGHLMAEQLCRIAATSHP
jgi:hypothetical protein